MPRYISCLIVASFFIFASNSSSGEEAQLKIAKIDYGIISQTFPGDHLVILTLDQEILDQITKLKADQERLLKAVLVEKDPVTVAKLKSEKQLIDSKLFFVKEIARDWVGSGRTSRIVQQFVVKKYADKYQVFVDTDISAGLSYRFTTTDKCKVEDITQKVIADLEKVLP